MAEFDTILKAGTIIDGMRTPRFVGDLGIKEGRITYIGDLKPSDGDRCLDASGLIVAPGFVDYHTHYDSQLFWDPYCTLSGWHGVTSVVIGNCGFAFAPVRPEDRDRAMLTVSRNEAVPLATMKEGMPWDWETFPEFMDSVERTPKGVNVLALLGLSPLLLNVMGIESKGRSATDAEMERMCEILYEAMEAGACGFSTQRGGEDSIQRDYDGTPMITDIQPKEDVLKLAQVLRKVGRGFIQGAGERELAEELCEMTGGAVMSGLGVTTDQHGQPMENYKEQIQWLADANARGHRVFAQLIQGGVGFQFTLEDWNLFDTSALWRRATLGTPAERAAEMRDPELRAAIKEEYDGGKDPLPFTTIPTLYVQEVVAPELHDSEGMTLGELAERDQKHVIDAFLDLALADELRTTFVTPPRERSADEWDALKEVCNSPYALPGVSDGGAHTKFITLGAYTTEYLSEFVRDHEVQDLEEAHWRLSGYPAQAIGFKDRGWIKEGAPADLVVYDLEALSLRPVEKAWDFPADEWRRVRKPDGYRWIMVNGEVTFEDGECTEATPGALLRHGTA